MLKNLGVVSDTAAWPARRSSGGDAAVWVAGVLLFAALAALVFGGSREPGPTLVGLCVLAVVLAAAGAVLLAWAIGYRQLAYVLTDSALRIEWLGRTTVVPYGAIHGIYTGQRLAGHATADLPRWPGINVGSARVRGLGRLRFFATATDQAVLTFITVEHGGVILSPREPQEFRAALIEHVEAAQDQPHEPLVWRQIAPSGAPWTALADPSLPIAVAAGLVVLLVTLALIAARFNALPDQIVMHFDASGAPSQIASRFDLLRLPFLGLVLLALNAALGVWLHARDRLLARVLWSGGVVVQVALLLGVLRLLA